MLPCLARRVQPATYYLLTFVLCLARVQPTCLGEERLPQLPKDSAWVRYQMDPEVDGKKNGAATVTLSFVGTAVEKGVVYRWIEIKRVITEPAAIAGTTISKILVPEKALIENDTPLDQVRRMWMQGRDKSVKQSEKVDAASLLDESLLWTPGMLKDSKPVDGEAKDIQYQNGQFKNSAAKSAERVYKNERMSAQLKSDIRREMKFTVWTHPDLPIGFAEARLESQRFRDDSKTGKPTLIVYRIQDFGAGAKSELPDNN